MKTITTLEQLQRDMTAPCVAALGTFDGVHIGHCDVISTAREYAKEHGFVSAVFTFQNHPLSKIMPEKVPPVLMSTEQKKEVFAALGIDFLICIPFTEEFAQIQPKDFMLLMKKCNFKALVVGENFTFGFQGRGDVSTLRKEGDSYDLKVFVRDLIKLENSIVCSTNIRHFIRVGDMEIANRMLGREYSITGTVVAGLERGRKIGFPTANIELRNTLFALPKLGAYEGRVTVEGKEYRALVNVGNNPTFDMPVLLLETYLLGYEGNLYGKRLTVRFCRYLREEKKFSGVEALREQLVKDKLSIEKIIENKT